LDAPHRAARPSRRSALALLTAAALVAGCGGRKKPPRGEPVSDDAGVLAAAAWGRELPEALRGGFSIRIDAPRLGVVGSTTGALIVHHPSRFRIEVFAPIVGPRLYAVSDGAAVNIFVVPQNTYYSGPDAEAVLREATGGAAGLKDLVALLVGRLPFQDAEIVEAQVGEASAVYTFSGPEGTRAKVALDPRDLTTMELEAFDAKGQVVLSARYPEYKRRSGALLPEQVEIEVPSLEMSLALDFRGFDALDEPPEVFDLKAPSKAARVDLMEQMKSWAEAAGAEDSSG